MHVLSFYGTYGHSQLKTGHPVRSAIHKQLNGRLVLRWVTTWESLLLYVLFCTPQTFHSLSTNNTLFYESIVLFYSLGATTIGTQGDI
jgi:hypothetical protein